MTPVASQYFRWGTQSRKLYDRLACGPVTGSEIVRELKIHQYHKKISEIRARIAGTGVTVKARPINGRRKLKEYRLGVENAGNNDFSSNRISDDGGFVDRDQRRRSSPQDAL